MDWTADLYNLTRPTVEPPALAPEDYREALLLQTSLDLTSLTTSFSRALKKIWDESRRHGQGMEWVNHHPICRLYAERTLDLAGIDRGFTIDSTYDEAYTFCEKEAAKTLKEGERPPWRVDG